MVTNNTLELASDTFFLGMPSLGSKLFIRRCFKELSELIVGSATSGMRKNIVVAGTPGIGKSVFGFYLLYLLRCEGKTVVFQRQDRWFRFSNAGVQQGSFSDFFRARYLQNDCDINSWFLCDPKNGPECDPEDRPEECFVGTTVALVTPEAFRVNEFLKQVNSERFFMPVWSEDELLECQRAVFPHVRRTDVEKAFGVVGGVARAVFDVDKLGQIKRDMEDSVADVDINLLRSARVLSLARSHPDYARDALFHIFPGSENKYGDYTVRLASSFAEDLVVEEVSKKEKKTFSAIVEAAFTQPDLARLLGEAVMDCLFKEAAHRAICPPQGYD